MSRTPARIAARPASMPGPTGSPRATIPPRAPKTGIRNVTLAAVTGPADAIRKK